MYSSRICRVFILQALLYMSHALASPYKYHYPKLQNIHRSMKKRDLSRIFGVEEPHNVPPYHVVLPYIEHDSFTRKRRNIENEEPINFNFGVSAFDVEFKLNLTLNRHLFGPNFKIEIKGKNGTVVAKDTKNCHYSGKVNGQPNSVAGSGLFKLGKHDYFIEPVPGYLHQQKSNAPQNKQKTKLQQEQAPVSHYHQPHIVYRRSVNLENNAAPSQMFQRLRYKDAKKCSTPTNPYLRLRRSVDDASNFVKSDNTERYIETLVVVDQKMVNYHGEDAATQFALVILNIVASLLRDGSIGSNLIILVVLKLQLHTVDIAGLVINHHARNTLESFGRWAARASDQDDRSDDHFDYAILLTRYNICADDRQKCDSLGLTQVGGMCNWPYSASINEDNGLPLAYTVAHNIGHSLGMNHDGDESSYICPDNSFIMSSTTTPQQDWKDSRTLWSRCSRNYLRNFLKKSQAVCLLDPPVRLNTIDFHKMENKAGTLYDIGKQCEMQFGTGSKICHKSQLDSICNKLQCTNPNNPDKCFTSSYPAADGTQCALSKFCYRGECVAAGEVKSTDGGWSNWSDDYSQCSRTCGGGVQYRKRQCNHPKPSSGGKYCEGDSRFYRLCSQTNCDNNLKSHRTVQCSSLDDRLFGERKFEWEFKPSKIDSCKLGCFISGTGHGYDFGNVEDGTNCDQMDESVIADKCINGECVTVGCDAVLGSKAKFDRCGICNGDGSSCATGTDRSEIPEISTGGGGIADALKSLKDMGFDMGSLYGRSELSLTEKRSGVPKHDDSVFGWARIKSGCSVSCGGGIEVITPECRRQDDGSPANEDRCDRRSKPPVQQYPCKEEACPPAWQTSYWGDCSRTCNGGFKKRNVRCVQRAGNGIEYDVDGSLCTGARPSDTEGCNKESCPAEWIAQPFGECSTICGPGVQIRDVFCQKTLKDGTLLTEKPSDCRKETKPPSEQKCNVHNPCPGDAGCGGIYTDTRGNFSSPEYPNNYPNNMECVHIIQVQEGKVIRLEFDTMKIVAPDEKECKNDFIKVMDGDCVSRLGESKFCGRTIPPPFVSTTNRLCIKFYSDDSQNDEGFVAKYRAVDKSTQNADLCGYNYTAPAGLISSPNYPEYYPPNEDCNITVITEDKPVKMTFHAFDVGSDDCTNDYVFLSGGDENKKYCGQKIPPVYTSNDNSIVLRFFSTNRPTTTKPGFVATYTSGNPDKSDKSADTRQQIPILDSMSNVSQSGINVINQSSVDTSAKLQEVQKTLKLAQETLKEAQIPATEQRKSNIYPEPGLDIPESTTNYYAPQMAPSEQQFVPVSFVSSNPGEEISKDVLLNAVPNKNNLTPEQRAYANAMKDDTPPWIPEPAMQTFRLPAVSSDRNSKLSATLTATFHKTPPPVLHSLAAVVPSNRQQVPPNRQQVPPNRQQVPPKPAYTGAVKRFKYPNPVIPKPQFVLKANRLHEDIKKSAVMRGLSGYEHNLDGRYGECPQITDLKCIRILLSYPCTSDLECRAGFACCTTACEFGAKICTPKVTRSCPLRDPFYFPYIKCRTEFDCPNRSPCCLDMGNRRYCRHLLTNNWQQ